MIDVLERYQPLQRVNRLQTGDARLPRQGGELLNTRVFTLVQNPHRLKSDSFYRQSPPAHSPAALWLGHRSLLESTKKLSGCQFSFTPVHSHPLTVALRRRGVFLICWR